jgi:hypothetical protein
MATFWSALVCLGSGIGAGFTELSGNGYARAAVNFGTPDPSGRSQCLSTASFTPTGAWVPVTQLAVADATSGAVLIVLEFAAPVAFAVNVPNTIAPGRLSITVPLPAGVGASLSWSDANNVTNEVGASATSASVELGADVVILTPASVIANIAAGG